MHHIPFYDPGKSYEENFEQGPFGAFADGVSCGEDSNIQPKYDFMGFKVNSPFGIPAGPLLNGNFVKAAFDKGFDICVYKTVRSSKYPCHPWPNVLSVQIFGDLTPEIAEGSLRADGNFEKPLSITNSFGVPSMSPEFWVEDIREAINYAHPGQIVVGSFQGTKKKGQSVEEYVNDFKRTAGMLRDAGVKVIEVNLSCPNEGTDNLLCYDTERSVRVVKEIKETVGDMPLIIKIGYFKDFDNLKNLVKEIGPFVGGISAINTIATKIVDEKGNQALPGMGRLHSGVCGSAIKWAGLEMVLKLKKLREEFGYNFQIIGVGGVMNVGDFFEYQKAGADIVMSATGAMWNPNLAIEIKKSMK